MGLREIEKIRKHQGYTLTQEKREDKWAIYRVDKGSHYEVVRIRTRNTSGIGGGVAKSKELGFTHMEVYPHSETWGRYGFTHTNKLDAENRFKEKVEEEKSKKHE